MNTTHKYGQWACVIGAAEGLGAAFAFVLAKRGFQLLLIDYKEPELDSTAKKILLAYPCTIKKLICDLSKGDAAERIMHFLAETNCRLLVYNAAYGPVKPFLSNTEEELDLYLSVNNRTLLHLVHGFIKNPAAGRKGLLLVSSLAGWRGTQLVVPYAATKAFIWNLAEGLHYEFKHRGLDVSVLCPGTVDTPAFRSTGAKSTFLTPAPMNPEHVAEFALRKFGRQLFIIPGFLNNFAHFLLQRILPRKLSSKIHNDAMAGLYSHIRF